MLDSAFLGRVDYFQGLPEAALARLAALAVEVRLAPKQALFLEGETCPGLYLVREGRIRIYKSSSDGREQVLRIARVGESFAEVPVFDGGFAPASADAMEPSIVYLLPTASLIALVQRSPEIGLGVLRVFAQRLRHLTGLVEDLSFRHVTARVAKLLLQRVHDGDADGSRMTQQEMAAMIGTAREVVTRSLRMLEQQGAIKMEHGQIIVLNPDLLERLV